MFYEYAVDPKCFANWDSFRLLIGQFGWKQGRLISKFPRNWKKRVHDIIQENQINNKKLTFMQHQKITDELEKNIFIKSNQRFDSSNCDWLNNAIHNITVFRAIIAYDNLEICDKVLIASELIPDDFLWKVEFTDIIPSTPDELCKCVEKLLQESSEILFIDPYFFRRDKAKDRLRWLTTLEKFIAVVNKKEDTFLQYHLEISDEEYFKPEEKRKEDFQKECDKEIKKLLPYGRIITFFRWKKIDHSGDKFHARYVLTNLGGVWFDVGLDKGKSGETTNVARLEDKVWNSRFNSFKEGSKVYEFVDKVDVIGE
jgi:hypothetical protein